MSVRPPVTPTQADRAAAAVFTAEGRCSICRAVSNPDVTKLVRLEVTDHDLVRHLGGGEGDATTLWGAVCPTCLALGEKAVMSVLIVQALRAPREAVN